MKKQLISTVAIPALALAAWAVTPSTASADVIIDAEIKKTKTILVDEIIKKTKLVDIDVTKIFDLDSAAESMAVVNAANEDNVVDGYDGQGITGGVNDLTGDITLDFGLQLKVELIDSIASNDGIVLVNLDAGNIVNQGNVVAFALTGPQDPEDDGSLAHSQAEVEQRNLRNFVFDTEVLDPEDGPPFDANKTVLLDNSVNDNIGIVLVNLNVGNTTNQHNVVALSVGFDAVVALSEAALGQFNADNDVVEIETVKTVTITDSINRNTGIVGVNGNTGNHNNQAFVLSFSALTSTAVIGVPGS